jgi:hypothetical protein
MFCIDHDLVEDGHAQLRKVFSFESDQQLEIEWEQMKKERKEFLQKKNTSVGIADIFTDPKYQPLTLFAAISSFINQMSGITAINIYQATILG